MRNTLASCLLAFLCLLPLNAQNRPKSYDNDLGVTFGLYAPMHEGIGSDATVGLTCGHFYHNGLGFRTGLRYTPSVAHVDHSFGIPIAIAYRSVYASGHDRLRSGVTAAASTAVWRSVYSYDGSLPFRDMLVSFISGLISSAELSAGITPGYVAGASSPIGTSYLSGGDYTNSWTERRGRLSMSLDVGASLNYSIWRFDIRLMPGFHYMLTDNYVLHNIYGNEFATGTRESTQPLRWFFSFSGGLAFRF